MNSPMDAEHPLPTDTVAELLARVSHELRSPLTSIKGFTSTLLHHEERLSPSERRSFLQAISESSGRMEKLITRVLTLSHLEYGIVVLHLTTLHALPLLHEIMATCTSSWEPSQQRRFHFTPENSSNSTEDDVYHLMADKHLLHEAFCELFDNAHKYSPHDSPIEVSIHAHSWQDIIRHIPAPFSPPLPDAHRPLHQGMIEICVQDFGIGIPSSHLQQIFERFHRLDTALTQEAYGLGLGLALCQHIIALHHGLLWVESQLNVGSTFHVVLPTQQPTLLD